MIALTSKKFLYFLKRKIFMYFPKWSPARFSPDPKNKTNSPRGNYYTSGNGNPEKMSYISGNRSSKKAYYI